MVAPRLGAWSWFGVQDGGDLLADAGHVALERYGIEIVLRPEGVVERATVDPEMLDEIFDRRGLVALGPEQVEGDIGVM